MSENLRDYMTEGEKQIMDLLLEQAEERKQQQRQQANIFAFKKCQCEVYEQMPEERRKTGGSCMADMQEFLAMVCQFCQEHGCCKCREGEEREEGEELPF